MTDSDLWFYIAIGPGVIGGYVLGYYGALVVWRTVNWMLGRGWDD